MSKACSLLLCALLLPGCSPSVDRGDSEQALAESGVPATGSRRGGKPVAKGAENVTLDDLPENAVTAPEGEDASPTNDEANNAPAVPVEGGIPVQYQGRWGMVAADCEPKRSDAKGLLTIDGRTLRFYEAVGTLREQRPAIATSFSGDFSFTGEGQTWERVVTLTRSGDTLTRADDEGRYTYTRC